jgi:malate/lactate dehydrogenase
VGYDRIEAQDTQTVRNHILASMGPLLVAACLLVGWRTSFAGAGLVCLGALGLALWLGRGGAEKVLELPLTPEEKQELDRSADAVREGLRLLGVLPS